MHFLNVVFKKKKFLDNRFSPATVYRYKKFYKIKHKLSAIKFSYLTSRNLVSFFQIKLIARSVRLFKVKNLKSVKMFVRKPYTKIIGFPAVPYMGFSRKPSEVRMGKGKGSKIAFRAFPLKCGTTIVTLPQRETKRVTFLRSCQKLLVYSNKFNSFGSHIFQGNF